MKLMWNIQCIGFLIIACIACNSSSLSIIKDDLKSSSSHDIRSDRFVRKHVASTSIKLNEDKPFYIKITNGSYSLLVQNRTWLKSSPTFLRANNKKYSTDNSGDLRLVLNNTLNSIGNDSIGEWTSTTYAYTLSDDVSKRIIMLTTFIVYSNTNLVRFTQTFPNGLVDCAEPNNYESVISAFPAFKVETPDENDIGYLSYGGMMSGDMEKVFGKWNSLTTHINDGIAGGPLILFNTNGSTLVVSSMSHFMASSMNHEGYSGGQLNYGIMSGINRVPVNYSIDFMVYYGNKGINNAMEGWGSILLKYYKKDVSIAQNDFIINNLAYWTDNGAYYYWLTEENKNYQDTIIDVVNFSKQNNLPYKSIQYDSWWYGAEKGYRQGCIDWNGNKPLPNSFPNSSEYVYAKTQLPVTAHNKFWDYSVVYAKQNGGQYNFVLDDFTRKSLPNDTRFWDDLFANATKWGLKTYEQDWLNHQILDFTPLMTDINLGRTWLSQMNSAALKYNMTLQYCMSLSRHVLQSVEFNAVTQIRVTNDYATNWNYGAQQWRVGISSIFASSLGLKPFKDVYWTSKEEPGNPYGPKAIELSTDLNSVVSILTSGPVGPGDKIDYMNRTLIMRSCNDDGLLLKPSRPITAIDQQIHARALGNQHGPDGEVWTTYSMIGEIPYGIILAADIKSVYEMSIENIGIPYYENNLFWKDNDYNWYPFNNGSSAGRILLNDSCQISSFCLYHISPIFNINGKQVALIGEQAKWVPVSPQRFTAVTAESTRLTANVTGVLNEIIILGIVIDYEYQRIDCKFIGTTKCQLVVDLSQTPVKLNCNRL